MSYLLDERPLLVMPKLAATIGLNEAIVVQQLHYWLQKSNHNHEGRKWAYNTYDSWQEQFPFWSLKTIKRTISYVETKGIIICGNFNKAKFDKTKWYTIDYEKLNSIMSQRWGQSDPTEGTKCPDGGGQSDPMGGDKVTRPIPDTTTEITTKTTSETTKEKGELHSPTSSKSHDIEFVIDEVIKYVNLKTGRKYGTATKEYRKHIGARLKNGATLEEIKYVVDVKCAEWLHDEKMKQYLNPKTLFNESNFDRYLNQEMPKQKEKTLRDLINEGQVDLSDVL